MKINIEKNILSKNDEIAARLREEFARHKLLVVNLLSSPGSGKTSLLERTAEALAPELGMAVIVGDLQTERDANRVRKLGVQAVQVNTGRGCHLNANMVADALPKIEMDGIDVLFVENVGNLVCPAAFDLGEDLCAVLISVTEGDDKPEKYPTAILKADIIVVNKTDLAPYVNWSTQRATDDIKKIKPALDVMEVSCTRGDGLEGWYQWLKDAVTHKKQR